MKKEGGAFLTKCCTWSDGDRHYCILYTNFAFLSQNRTEIVSFDVTSNGRVKECILSGMKYCIYFAMKPQICQYSTTIFTIVGLCVALCAAHAQAYTRHRHNDTIIAVGNCVFQLMCAQMGAATVFSKLFGHLSEKNFFIWMHE